MAFLESFEKCPVNMDKWTVDAVKDCLPLVKVEISGKIFPAVTSGRKNRFCGVYVPQSEYRFEFAWETVARSLNNNMPLLV